MMCLVFAWSVRVTVQSGGKSCRGGEEAVPQERVGQHVLEAILDQQPTCEPRQTMLPSVESSASKREEMREGRNERGKKSSFKKVRPQKNKTNKTRDRKQSIAAKMCGSRQRSFPITPRITYGNSTAASSMQRRCGSRENNTALTVDV